jgi:hypothetical protein
MIRVVVCYGWRVGHKKIYQWGGELGEKKRRSYVTAKCARKEQVSGANKRSLRLKKDTTSGESQR